MVPQTVVAVLVFALLIVPGITFELARQTRRPGFDQTALEEVSRVLVASVGFGSIAASLLAVASLVFTDLVVEVSVLAARGAEWYWRHHPGIVIRTVVLEVVLATAAALLVHRSLNQADGRGWASVVFKEGRRFLGHQPGEQVERFPLWRTLFRELRPPGSVTKVTILKTDRTLITGIVGGYDTSGHQDDRDVALVQPIEVFRSDWEGPRQLPDAWKFLIVPGHEISEVFLTWPRRDQPASGLGQSDTPGV